MFDIISSVELTISTKCKEAGSLFQYIPIFASIMTVEAILTRKFGITFIDARQVANEAKLALDIQGYPTAAQRAKIINHAMRIFHTQPCEVTQAMQARRTSLQSVMSSSEFCESEIDDRSDHFSVASTTSSSNSRKGLGRIFRR